MTGRPWMMRTYSGHSTAAASNALYRTNLAKGQTGLSVAFDLPTQTGYDPDHTLARGEVGKVGVPIAHRGNLAALFDGIPLGDTNTSMTINATAPWLLALYLVTARSQGAKWSELRGTTQNDIVKEYLSRGTFIFDPEDSRRLTVDMFEYCSGEVPRWNPMNVCSYHLQEAGATPVQEIAYSLATAIDVLDAIRARPSVDDDRFASMVASVSFFVNSGIRFVEEVAKMRAFTQLWDRILTERYGITDPKAKRFRYGVQVNSLGLTEAQPENNVQRIVLEMLGVTLSAGARARSIQLPAWNEALGLPRPWDQQWSLRMQQVLAFETDLLEYEDIFSGSVVVESKTAELTEAAMSELDDVLDLGGAFAAIPELKRRLVHSHAARIRRIESGDLTVVGVNRFTETADSPLTTGEDAILVVDPEVEAHMIDDVERWRNGRDQRTIDRLLADLAATARGDDNIMAPTLALADAGGTTGEWADCLREVFGEYRAPTGVAGATGAPLTSSLRELSARIAEDPLGPPRLLVGKPGLDGHSNGAEQIAIAARDAGMEVIYQGIRLTPGQIAVAARDEDVDAIGLSILSGSHRQLVPATVDAIRAQGVEAPIVVGGILPPEDHGPLFDAGVAAVFTPKDYDVGAIIGELYDLIRAHRR